MIARLISHQVQEYLREFPAVALLGPRQVGKTTLALQLREHITKPTHYLDLELAADRNKLTEPEIYFDRYQGQLVILDEIQRVPELFPLLRGLIDQRKRQGEKAGHYLLLGSASPDLLRQSSESLAGRIAYLELLPFSPLEVMQRPRLTLNGCGFAADRPTAILRVPINRARCGAGNLCKPTWSGTFRN